MTNPSAVAMLAQQVLTARATRTPLISLDPALVPASVDEAYQVQRLTMATLGGIGAYKIGAKTPEQAPLYAPIPARVVWAARGATAPVGAQWAQGPIARGDFNRIGLELEIAFRFSRTLVPADAEASDAELLALLSDMLAVVEIVDSRYAQPAAIDKLAQLADLQNNGALIVGSAVPYDPAFDFMAPALRFSCGTQTLFAGRGSNPAGDPRRLVLWLARHVLGAGMALESSTVLTAGAYTGGAFDAPPGCDTVSGEIEGIGRVEFSLV